eukprot:6324716-Amphidinium_carterae.1
MQPKRDRAREPLGPLRPSHPLLVDDECGSEHVALERAVTKLKCACLPGLKRPSTIATSTATGVPH